MITECSRRNFLANAFSAVTTTGLWIRKLEIRQSVCPEKHDDIYYDQNGLIVQKNCDGGDTAQREGMYWLGNWVRINDLHIEAYGMSRKLSFMQVMDLLEDERKSGVFRRHPTQKEHNDPKKTSRDQLIPLIAAMGVYKDFTRLDRLRDKIKNSYYFVNKDQLILFEEFIKRARDVDLLLNGDVDRILMDSDVTLRHREAEKDMDNVGDDLNLIVRLLLAAIRRGDQIKAVRARYVYNRPKNYGVYLTRYHEAYPNDFSADKDEMIQRIEEGIKKQGWKPDCTNVFGVFKWYFRAEAGGSPGLAAMYKPILDKYFAGPIPS